jgi:hypothetical protein
MYTLVRHERFGFVFMLILTTYFSEFKQIEVYNEPVKALKYEDTSVFLLFQNNM